MIPQDKSTLQLVREDAARQALEAAAKKLEQHAGGQAYTMAFAKAARLVRELKPT